MMKIRRTENYNHALSRKITTAIIIEGFPELIPRPRSAEQMKKPTREKSIL